MGIFDWCNQEWQWHSMVFYGDVPEDMFGQILLYDGEKVREVLVHED